MRGKSAAITILTALGILAGAVELRYSVAADDDEETEARAQVVTQFDALARQVRETRAESSSERSALRAEVASVADAVAKIDKNYGNRLATLEREQAEREEGARLEAAVAAQLRSAIERGRRANWDRALDGFQEERAAWEARQAKRRAAEVAKDDGP